MRMFLIYSSDKIITVVYPTIGLEYVSSRLQAPGMIQQSEFFYGAVGITAWIKDFISVTTYIIPTHNLKSISGGGIRIGCLGLIHLTLSKERGEWSAKASMSGLTEISLGLGTNLTTGARILNAMIMP